MNNLKKYSKPVMQMEQFVPQQYCEGCTTIQLYCNGGYQTQDRNHWIFNMNTAPPTYIGDITADGNEHGPHWMDVYVKGEVSPSASDAELLALVANSTYFNAVMASSSATTQSGPNGTIELKDPPTGAEHGVAWTVGTYLHFASDVQIAPNPWTNHS